jgi:uncharacterized membrane protein YgdD (TMEM256/DUF423 family)
VFDRDRGRIGRDAAGARTEKSRETLWSRGFRSVASFVLMTAVALLAVHLLIRADVSRTVAIAVVILVAGSLSPDSYARRGIDRLRGRAPKSDGS